MFTRHTDVIFWRVGRSLVLPVCVQVPEVRDIRGDVSGDLQDAAEHHSDLRLSDPGVRAGLLRSDDRTGEGCFFFFFTAGIQPQVRFIEINA